MRKSAISAAACPIEVTLAVIGGKWKSVLLFHLMERGVVRFGELRKLMPSITQQMLTNHLRELEADGIVTRKVYAEVPPRVEYSLTELGASLSDILDRMCDWGKRFEQVKVP